MASSLDLGRIAGVLTGFTANILGILSSLIFIATLVLFIGFDSGKFPRNLFAARGERPSCRRRADVVREGHPHLPHGLGDLRPDRRGHRHGRPGAARHPGAFVWGVLAFVTNFIPNIGFVIGVIPPAIIGLLEGGPGLMLAVIVLYSVINFVIQSIIQPKYQADALGLTTTLTFLSLVFWAWVLGPLGAMLALPLTLLLKALFVDVDPRSQWLGPLLSGVPLPEPEPEPEAEPDTDPAADHLTDPVTETSSVAPPPEPRR